MSESEIQYRINDMVTPIEMLSLAETVDLGPHRTLERNEKAIEGSIFIATARCKNELVGLIRLIGDGAYILHIADMMVHPKFQAKGVGKHLLNSTTAFAKQKCIGTGDNLGEFTLFAEIGAEEFYLRCNFISVPNGMCFVDSEGRQKAEHKVQKHWESKKDFRKQP